jgi:hypothetical protein
VSRLHVSPNACGAYLPPWARFLVTVAAMKKLKVVAVAVVLFAFSVLTPSLAQQYGREYGRPQDGFVSGQYSGQYGGQYSGQYDSRVDGRASPMKAFLQAQRTRAMEGSTILSIQKTAWRPSR